MKCPLVAPFCARRDAFLLYRNSTGIIHERRPSKSNTLQSLSLGREFPVVNVPACTLCVYNVTGSASSTVPPDGSFTALSVSLSLFLRTPNKHTRVQCYSRTSGSLMTVICGSVALLNRLLVCVESVVSCSPYETLNQFRACRAS